MEYTHKEAINILDSLYLKIKERKDNEVSSDIYKSVNKKAI